MNRESYPHKEELKKPSKKPLFTPSKNIVRYDDSDDEMEISEERKRKLSSDNEERKSKKSSQALKNIPTVGYQNKGNYE